MKYLLIYFAIISLIAVFVTIHDKRAAKKHRPRTKENTMLLISVLGGSLVMLVVMRLIRHKTKHMKFMIGIPFIIILQGVAIGLLVWKGILPWI